MRVLRKILLFVAFAIVSSSTVRGQVQGFTHSTSEADGYEWPADVAVREKLSEWQGLKFGILVHWGLYSLPGIVESWSICSEDVDWIPRRTDISYEEYKKWYWGLAKDFRPASFDAADWAKAFRDAGAKYAVLTTKHHDGYCLFRSAATDFSLPASGGPDAVAEVFEALRKENIWVGAYFSKPDWHCPWYWNPNYSTPNRRENYRRERHPEWWQQYRGFTQLQLRELTQNYGRLDILWLDGGWVSGDEIGLDTLLAEARGASQRGMLCVDRTIRGKNENYLTPERGIPATQLDVPWESCIPLSNDWGWVPDAPYKSWEKVVTTLAEVVAKGGSLLLGVGPCADGTLEPAVRERLVRVGEWLRKNGEAIYETSTTPHYNEGPLWFTRGKDCLYAIVTSCQDERLSWHKNIPSSRPILLSNGHRLRYSIEGDSVVVRIPKDIVERGEPFVLKFSVQETPKGSHQLTLREKIGQLRCVMGWEMVERTQENGVRLTQKFFDEMRSPYPAGGLWAVMRADPWTRRSLTNGLTPELARRAADSLQHYASSHASGGLPLLLVEECPHGHMAIGQTVFPTGLAIASTWNPKLLRRVGRRIGYEARSVGASLALGPVLDVARDPRWSRMEETLGEDAMLASRLGGALMEGIQENLPACLKHFAAYGIGEGGHNGGDAWVGENYLRNELLPPFRDAVRKGASALMTSYNTIDGIPATANMHLLRDVLRGEWGFDGVVISDLFAIDGLISQGLAANRKEAAALALRAGVDIDLGGNCYGLPLEDAIREGLVSEAELDAAVERVLRLKNKMPSRNVEEPAKVPLDGGEGLVMLKNSGILPLAEGQRLLVVGPNADAMYNQLGDYTAPQPEGKVKTVLDGIRNHANHFASVEYVRGCGIRDTASADIEAAVAAAQRADVVLLVVGGSSARDFHTEYRETGAAETTESISDMDCGEGLDRSTLSMLGKQEELLAALAKTGRPIVTVVIAGRSLLLNNAAEMSQALICAWYPGEMGGESIARTIIGDTEPAGRLPVTLPRSEGQLPIYYSQGTLSDYTDGKASPLYPFGFGLGYTTFSIDDLRIESCDKESGLALISVRVTNTGKRRGSHVVQAYQHAVRGGEGKPKLSLADFRRVELNAGESQRVELSFKPFALTIEVRVGSSSADVAQRTVIDLSNR